MPGKLPIDRVREAKDAPKVYDEHRERFSQRQAELRDADADDPVAGARPAATTPAPADSDKDDDRDRSDDA
ncbi:MAG: hypothetical protein WEC14_00280 [Chloroflexota bacterium]